MVPVGVKVKARVILELNSEFMVYVRAMVEGQNKRYD